MVDLCYSLCTMLICIWLMWTQRRTRESHPLPSSQSWLYTAVCWGSVHACACICTHPVFVHRRVHAACFRERTKTPSGPVTECASMKHFCHFQVPFWCSLEVEWSQAESCEGSHLRRPLTLGAPELKPFPALQPSCTTLTRGGNHSSGVWWFSSPAFTSIAPRFNTV